MERLETERRALTSVCSDPSAFAQPDSPRTPPSPITVHRSRVAPEPPPSSLKTHSASESERNFGTAGADARLDRNAAASGDDAGLLCGGVGASMQHDLAPGGVRRSVFAVGPRAPDANPLPPAGVPTARQMP